VKWPGVSLFLESSSQRSPVARKSLNNDAPECVQMPGALCLFWVLA